MQDSHEESCYQMLLKRVKEDAYIEENEHIQK